MKRYLDLNDRAFDAIQNKTKRVEIRLLDEKRSKLKIGDMITFTNYDDSSKSFDTEITNLLVFNDINEVLNNYDISLLLSKSTKKDDLINIFNSIYSIEERNKYKIICIEFKIKNDR